MINQAGTDRLEDAIDCFEANWTPDSQTEIPSLLERFGLDDDLDALTELIRIDIELRYDAGIDAELDEYFRRFEKLRSEPKLVAEIAFEDFRSRAAYGHPLLASRWRELPGVRNQSWYQQIANDDRSTPPHRRLLPSSRGDHVEPQSAEDIEIEAGLESIGFRLIDAIGQGAFSRVYLATQNDLANRYVVLKVVRQTLSEPEKMARLQHTNIVPIYSFHRIRSRSVLCMPYAGVATLADFLESEQQASTRVGQTLVTTVLRRASDTWSDEALPQVAREGKGFGEQDLSAVKPLDHLRRLGRDELAIWVFRQLSAALSHAHARGVLHGDLKPANVLIRNDGEPALLDFNLAQSLDQERIDHLGGTLPYMAPESYRAMMGQQVEPHAASDIYAIGVMLFEFVTGRLPFPSPRSAAAIDLEPALNARRQAPAWEAGDVVSPGLASIIERCLQFDPEQRYRSADQLQTDLDNERQNLPLVVAEESHRVRCKKWLRRHPRLVSGTSVGVLLAAMLIPVAVFAKLGIDRGRQLAMAAKVDQFAQDSQQVLSQSVADPLRHSDELIRAAIAPLEQYGILDPERRDEFDPDAMTEESSVRHNETVTRHLLHVAFNEAGRLRAGNQPPLDAKQLSRLDRLIDAAARYAADQPSRALLYARAARAGLARDAEATKLRERASQMPLNSDSEKYLEAIRLMSLWRYAQAREILVELSERGTIPSALRWTTLGRSQHLSGEHELAKLSFTKSLEYAPESSRLWYLRGRCFEQLRQYRRAHADLTRAIELDPDYTSALSSRALCSLALRQEQDAYKDFYRALEVSPDNVHVQLMLSRALGERGETAKAEEYLDLALQKEEGLTASELVSRGRARLEFDPQGSLADLQCALSMDRGSPAILSLIAIAQAEMGRDKDAVDSLSRYIAIQETEMAVINRAVLLARLGKVEQAWQDLIRAMKAPNAPEAKYQAACVHALLLPHAGNRRRALALLSQAVQAGCAEDIATDDDLRNLRDESDFQALVRTVELGAPRERASQDRPDSKAPDRNSPDFDSPEQPRSSR